MTYGASVEGQKTCANDKYDPWRNNCKHRVERQENKHGNKEALCCCPVKWIHKSIDRADQYLCYYSVLRKTVKWLKKVVLYLLNCALFNAFFMYRPLNTNKKVNYKNFLHKVGRSWISEVQIWSESILMTFSCQRSKQHQGGLNRTHQADSPVISEYTDLKKLVVGREKRSILQGSIKCVLHIRSEVKLDTFVNSALFRFTKGLVFRNTIQWQTTRLSTCSFCSLGLRSLICSVKPQVRICYGVEHSKRLKCPGTGGI